MATSIPVNHLLKAASDKELKLLLRQVETAQRRVAKAIEGQADAVGAVADYIARVYPDAPAERSQEDGAQ